VTDVIVGSRTHELRVFTGSIEDAREFAAGLVEQLREQAPTPPDPDVPPSIWQWTPENWRKSKDESACNIRQGFTSCVWSGPAGLEIRIEPAPETPGDAPAKPRHIGGRANAEDCPACTGDLPYPWICPGEPETPGDAERIADERPTGVHAFKQNPAATQVSVCICGKWRDHHMHGADPCGCDACRTPGDAEEATDER
jgi:hypothetical protein